MRWFLALRAGYERDRQHSLKSTNASCNRDGSASMTLMQSGDANSVLQYQQPPKDDDEARKFRTKQLLHRFEEVERTIDLFRQDERTKVLRNLWRHRSSHEAPERSDLIEDPLPLLRARCNPAKVLMFGHSFGAATALYAAQKDPRIAGVMALDPWLIPLPQTFFDEGISRFHPALVVNSDIFFWQGNKELLHQALHRLNDLRPSKERCGAITQVTVMKSEHMDQSDVSVILPNWLKRRYRSEGSADPQDILRLNCRLISSFARGLFGDSDGDFSSQASLDHLDELLWPRSGERSKEPGEVFDSGALRLDLQHK